jgi:hypothetical protein
MKRLALLLLLFALPVGAQVSNPSLISWPSATPPTSCPYALPVYIIAPGFTGAGNLYWNTSTGAGTSCSLLTSSGGSGTVTSVSVTTANGVSGTVANPTTTPAISLTLGAITPTSTNGVLAATMAFMDATSSVQTQLNAKGAGTVTAVSVASANGVSGTSSGGATPALTIALGAITPTSVTVAGDGTHAGLFALYGNTTVPTLVASQFNLIGPSSASVTAFGWQVPTAVNGSAGVLHVGAPSGAVSQLTVSAVSLTADVTGTLPVANGGTGQTSGTVTFTIASGTSALGTSAIASGTCATVVTTAGSGIATTDVVGWGFNGDPTAVTGYSPTTSGMLTIIAYPTSGNVNFKVCNNTSGSVTPGAITLNWRVTR